MNRLNYSVFTQPNFKKMITLVGALSLFFSTMFGVTAYAGEADVLKVRAKCKDNNKCRFTVRVKHKDKGWHHYADRWEVLSLEGEVLSTRVLAHPHVDEQPFTRSLTTEISPEYKTVIVRAHDSVDGYGGDEIRVDIRE